MVRGDTVIVATGPGAGFGLGFRTGCVALADAGAGVVAGAGAGAGLGCSVGGVGSSVGAVASGGGAGRPFLWAQPLSRLSPHARITDWRPKRIVIANLRTPPQRLLARTAEDCEAMYPAPRGVAVV